MGKYLFSQFTGDSFWFKNVGLRGARVVFKEENNIEILNEKVGIVTYCQKDVF